MQVSAYSDFDLYFGDIHNHCGISYGHGPLEDALANARERLDFVSITGHAHWPDMPAPCERLQETIDFHLEGFNKLKRVWPQMMRQLQEANEEGRFVVFPAFEVHFCATGDRNILYKELGGDILYPADLADLHRQLRSLKREGVETIAQPHHVGYRTGTRGIDWTTFDPEFAPVVELISMHGCSEASDNTRPFLHVMGPSDWESTIQYGLEQGHVFGVTGGTDHHSAHPGSYGHGLTGIWSSGATREALWEAFYARRTYALTGDRIGLQFALNGSPMGSVVADAPRRELTVRVDAGGALDYVDVVKNSRLLRRYSQYDFPENEPGNAMRTKLYLELGWGPREDLTSWEVEFGIRAGKIHHVEPRFRGRQVVSPLESKGGETSFYTARVQQVSQTSVTFSAQGEGNPNNFTANTQGMCLDVDVPLDSSAYAVIGGRTWEWPLRDLMAGARTDVTNGIQSPALRIHRAAQPHELGWQIRLEDEGQAGDFYYVRVRQQNDQWAWSSPIFLR